MRSPASVFCEDHARVALLQLIATQIFSLTKTQAEASLFLIAFGFLDESLTPSSNPAGQWQRLDIDLQCTEKDRRPDNDRCIMGREELLWSVPWTRASFSFFHVVFEVSCERSLLVEFQQNILFFFYMFRYKEYNKTQNLLAVGWFDKKRAKRIVSFHIGVALLTNFYLTQASVSLN